MNLVKLFSPVFRGLVCACLLPFLLLSQSIVWAEAPVLSAEAAAPIEQWKLERLPSDWWRALEQSDQASLASKLQALNARLSAEVALQPTQAQEIVSNQLDAIRLNTSAYADLRQ